MRDKQLIESLADYAHNAWAGWMHYVFDHCPVKKNDDGSITIPANLVERWRRQMDTKYSDLPEQEKESDRREAHKMLKLIPVAMPGAITNVVIKHEGADVAQVKALEMALTREIEERNRLHSLTQMLYARCADLERELKTVLDVLE